MAFRIVNIGDSIPWGQGLLEQQKYDSIIRTTLLPLHGNQVTLERLAHSGATIAPEVGPIAASGEVPVPNPTINAQLDAVPNKDTADLVLIDGGINDVGVTTILNPFAISPSLRALTERACHKSMLKLLQRAFTAFSKPGCRILVTGVYPILSDRSDPLGVGALLQLHGLQLPAVMKHDPLHFHNIVVDRCEEFHRVSEASLRQAVADVNDPRVTFVSSGYTDTNAMFVPGTSLLWGLDANLTPQDPVAALRRPQCDLTFPQPLEFPQREKCYRASAGHPNVAGARQYARQLLTALGVNTSAV